jgi:N-acetylmuramoyl-L-alanine amidase
MALAVLAIAALGAAERHNPGVPRLKPEAHRRQRTPVQVEYTYRGVGTQTAFRQGAGGPSDECLAPFTMLESWGWQITNQPNGRVRLQVEDQSIEVTPHQVEGQDCVLLREAIRLLDAESAWVDATHLQINGRVRVVRFIGHHLKVSASLDVTPKVTETVGGVAHIEFSGATLSPDAIIDVDPNVQVAPQPPNHLMVAFPAQGRFLVPADATQPTKELDLDASALIPATATGDGILLGQETGAGLSLDLGSTKKLTGPVHLTRVDATTLRISLPGLQLGDAPGLAQSPSIVALTPQSTDRGSELIVQLKRPMGVTLSQSSGRIQLALVKPPVGDGKIAGKLIVVDPGHGGKDPGAKHTASGLQEKELTLVIGKKLAADLAAEGATVIVTRDTDEFIPLEERAAIANRNHADLFLCVHINSNGADRKTSGSITFYHAQNPVSATLADCIEREISSASGIPGIGIWSDKKIYHSGFSVLRGTKMPGVLLELGFINNDHDRVQLVQPDVQDAIASAVVRGVKTYLGEGNAHAAQ